MSRVHRYHDLREPKWRANLRAILTPSVGVDVSVAMVMFYWNNPSEWPGFRAGLRHIPRVYLVHIDTFLAALAAIRKGWRWAEFVARAREALERAHAELMLERLDWPRWIVGMDLATPERIQGAVCTLFVIDDLDKKP